MNALREEIFSYMELGREITTFPGAITFQTTNVASSEAAGTAFDEQEVIRTSWKDPHVFIPPSSVTLFRGYPSSVTIQSDSDYVTHLFSAYQFLDEVKINGKEETYDEESKRSVDLVGKRVLSVSGSFQDGFLKDIQFITQDGEGNEQTSECFGAGDCSTTSNS